MVWCSEFDLGGPSQLRLMGGCSAVRLSQCTVNRAYWEIDIRDHGRIRLLHAKE